MRLSTWILVGLLLAGAVGGFVAWRRATEPARAWAEFLELEGVDVRNLTGSRRERAEALFDRFALIPQFGSDALDYVPWTVACLDPGGSAEEGVAFRVDRQLLHAYVGRGHGKGALTLTDVETALFSSAKGVYREELGGWCVQVGLSDRTRAYLVPLEHQLALVRSEDAEGRLLRGPWSGLGYWKTSLSPLEMSPEAWRAALEEGDVSKVLYYLCWLGLRDAGKPAERLTDILAHSRVRECLGRLRSSPNAWIREAAELALRP